MHPTTPGKPLRAYGDREGDGMVQLSFVLALPPSARAREAAKRFAEMHGLSDPLVATMESLDAETARSPSFTRKTWFGWPILFCVPMGAGTKPVIKYCVRWKLIRLSKPSSRDVSTFWP